MKTENKKKLFNVFFYDEKPADIISQGVPFWGPPPSGTPQ